MLAEVLITPKSNEVVSFNAKIRGQLAQGIGPLFNPYLNEIKVSLGDLTQIASIAPRVLLMRTCFERVYEAVQRTKNGQLYGAQEFGGGWEFHSAESPLDGDVSESEADTALTGALLHEVGNPLAAIYGYSEQLQRRGPPEALPAATAISRASSEIRQVLQLFQNRSVLEVVGFDNDVVRPNGDDEVVFPTIDYHTIQAAA